MFARWIVAEWQSYDTGRLGVLAAEICLQARVSCCMFDCLEWLTDGGR